MTASRGSAKLFDISVNDHAALAKAIGAAQDDYTVKWWWKYGQPAFIDRLELTIEVAAEKFGGVVGNFMQNNGAEYQVTAHCFPNSVSGAKSFRVGLEIQRSVDAKA
jgi:hypothetical protein